MFRIRDFSKLTRVSVKMLRHYDRLGLLPPARVDPRTRYRYYSAAQLTRLQRLVAMRDLGFSLAEIADLLGDGPPRELQRRLAAKRAEVEQRLEEERRRLQALEARLRDLDQGAAPLPDVVVRGIAPLRVASLRSKVDSLDDGARELFEAVEAAVARRRWRARNPPVLLYHDRDYRESQADIEVAVPVVSEAALGPVRGEGPRGGARGVTVRVLPALPRAACLVNTGSYDQLARQLGGVLTWLETHGLEVAGSWREVYLQFHADERLGLPAAFRADSPSHLVTEIQLPVRDLGPPASRVPRQARARRAPRSRISG
jgi:DNA-binding transcriptional MerR regulator